MATFHGRVFQNAFKLVSALSKNQSMETLMICSSNGPITRNGMRLVNTSSHQFQNQPLTKFQNFEGKEIKEVQREGKTLKVTFEDFSEGHLPFLWLRDNCQCPACFDKVAMGRKVLLQDLDVNTEPMKVEREGTSLKVTWNDGHTSDFDYNWIYSRAFNSQTRHRYRNIHRLSRIPWGKNVSLDTFLYNDLKTKDEALLNWLVTMEIKGVAVVKEAPDDPDSGPLLIEQIGFVKPSHYGRRSPVIVRDNANNVAFSNAKLGLHNDLSQYYYQAGMIFIHAVQQCTGLGGESTISDGLMATNILREKYPDAFNLLSKVGVYFWDKGTANNEMEASEFYKINKQPIIGLSSEGELETLRVNNQVRDSHLDLPPHEVHSFYEAMKLFNDILYEHSYNFKMQSGDILTLDNVRCLHGREGFTESSGRHIESSYLDWDEALCRRRRIIQNLIL